MHDETNTSEPNWADSGNALYVIYQSGIPYCYYYYYYHYYYTLQLKSQYTRAYHFARCWPIFTFCHCQTAWQICIEVIIQISHHALLMSLHYRRSTTLFKNHVAMRDSATSKQLLNLKHSSDDVNIISSLTERYSHTENNTELECGPMPNVMVALPNIGGALCSTPQSLADAHY